MSNSFNLDERIEAMLFDYSSAFDQHDNETTKPLIKQLIRDVLEYVKPERKLSASVPPGLPDSLLNRYQGNDEAAGYIEAKIKELGL